MGPVAGVGAGPGALCPPFAAAGTIAPPPLPFGFGGPGSSSGSLASGGGGALGSSAASRAHVSFPVPVQLQLQLDSPLKHDQPLGGLRFNPTPGKAVLFRGTVEVSGLDGDAGQPSGRRQFHLIQRSGQQGPTLGTVSLAPGAQRQLQVRLIYPADATPPQVLSLLPLQPPAAAGAPVKQSPPLPASRQP